MVYGSGLMSQRQTIVLNVPSTENAQQIQEALQQIARSLGYLWGSDGSSSALVLALAKGEVEVKLTPLGYERHLRKRLDSYPSQSIASQARQALDNFRQTHSKEEWEGKLPLLYSQDVTLWDAVLGRTA
jgi:hypothetical protein